MPPLRVETIKTRFKASVATPVTCRLFVSFAPPEGTLNTLRLSPDCKLYETTTPASDPTSPKFPHAVTAVVCILIPSVPISSCENETLTVTTPSVLSVHLPILFPSTLQLLPIDSPSWYVTTSSQSLDLAVENAMDLITGNLRDESETPRLEAFFAIDPVPPRQLHTLTEERGIPTLTELITTRVSYDRDVSQSTIFSSRQESLAIFSIVPHEADRRTVSGPLFEKSSRCSRRVEYPLLQRHISTAVK